MVYQKRYQMLREARNLVFVDATCPLVRRFIEAERHHKNGLQIVMIGHRGHPETIGTMGQLPEGEVLLVEDEVDVQNWGKGYPKSCFVTQTTLSIDDTFSVVQALQKVSSDPGPIKKIFASNNKSPACSQRNSK